MCQLVRGLLLLTALFVMSSPAAAQTRDARGTLSAAIGGGQTWDDESSIGTGALVGGRVDWRLFGTTSVELAVDMLTHDRSGGFFEAEGETALIGASLVHRVGQSAAQPYVLGGFGIVRHSGSTTFEGVRTQRSSTDYGYHFGGGVTVRVGTRLELGPEARFYMFQVDDGSSPAMAYWIGARVGVRF